MRYVARHLARTLDRALTTFPVVLVTGARQTGKTTLLKHELPGHRYVSLERPLVRERALADPVGFLAENPPPVVFDEVQYVPELLHDIKDRVDEDRRPGQWVLTGSQHFALMKGVRQTLAGRIAILDLEPLSVGETVGASSPSIDELIERVFSPSTRARATAAAAPELGDWLLRGGYPEPRLDERVDRGLWFSGYLRAYLDRDVRDVLGITDLRVFSRFMAIVAARTATTLNMRSIADDLGVSGPTVKSWLSVLEASRVVSLLAPYHENFGKRVRKAPKLYVLDPGLVSFMIGLHSAESILQGPSIGALTETAVVSEWIKAFHASGETPSLFYWQSNRLEVDLLIEREQKLYALEIKSTATPRPRHADRLGRWRELSSKTVGAAVACRVERPTALVPGIRAVPWHLAW